MNEEKSAILTLEGISFSYPNVRALESIELKLESGGIYGLLGPNGAGKTTLMKVLLGFLTPQSGKGKVLGFDVLHSKKEIRKRIGYMPESDCLIPGMDAVSETAYLGQLSGMPRTEAMKRAHDVLYYVGLEESRYRKVDTYSAGMKQRLKLAQALVHDPQLLLLDEPTSGMDPNGRKDMLELIHDIGRKGAMSIIVSSHLLPDIEATCQQVVIMNKGRIITQEKIIDISRKSQNIFEIRCFGPETVFYQKLKEKGCQVDSLDKGIYRLALPADFSSKNLFSIALAEEVQIRHLKKSQTTLEDAFMSAIGETNGY